MRRVSLVCLLAAFVAVASVSKAQDSTFICVQNDANGNSIVFNSSTGDYKIILCSQSAALSGTGQVSKDGCSVILKDDRGDYRVTSSVNVCQQEGKLLFEVFKTITTSDGATISPMIEAFGDNTLANNSCGQCPGGSATKDAGGRFTGPPVKQGSGVSFSGGPNVSDPGFIGPPVESGEGAEVIIQGDSKEGFLVFNTKTGDYKFTRCSDGLAVSGTGQLKHDGCFLSLEDNRPNYKIFANVNFCTQQGKLALTISESFTADDGALVTPSSMAFGDGNLRDSVASCSSEAVGRSKPGRRL
jgi:hypothetical protein